MTGECTAANVKALYPCLQCLSPSQLRMLLLYFWADLAGYTLPDDLTQLMEDSACFRCLSASDKARGVVALTADYFSDPDLINDLIPSIKCLPCGKPDQVEAAIVYSICKFFNG